MGNQNKVWEASFVANTALFPFLNYVNMFSLQINLDYSRCFQRSLPARKFAPGRGEREGISSFLSFFLVWL